MNERARYGTWPMRHDDTANHLANWHAEDFDEPANPRLDEVDPWEMPSADDEFASVSSADSLTAAAEEAVPIRANPAGLDSVDAFEVEGSDLTDWDEDGLDDVEPLALLPSAEWAVLLEWDSTQLGGSEHVGHDVLDDVEGDVSFLDEPVPWANYDSRLGTSLYETDEDLANLPWEIRVSEWVASISETNVAQRQEITDLLLGFSRPFLRSLLPWLRGQQWSGQSVLLFLQFRAYWDENPELWEASFWDQRLGCWRPTWSRYNLSRENQFELVQRRSNRSPEEIIDSTWFDDWRTYALWSHGYETFADFAVFRAVLAEREDWQVYVDWYRPGDLVESDSSTEDIPPSDLITPQLHLMFRQKCWFEEQDWHDPAEWHDGLGW